jgi:hypothetical protein
MQFNSIKTKEKRALVKGQMQQSVFWNVRTAKSYKPRLHIRIYAQK